MAHKVPLASKINKAEAKPAKKTRPRANVPATQPQPVIRGYPPGRPGNVVVQTRPTSESEWVTTVYPECPPWRSYWTLDLDRRAIDKYVGGRVAAAELLAGLRPLPPVYEPEAAPGGTRLFAALKGVAARYRKAAKRGNADELVKAVSDTLNALVVIMALGDAQALTAKPKSKRSVAGWAQAILRSVSDSTRATEEGPGRRIPGWPPRPAEQLYTPRQHEAVEALLKDIGHVRHCASRGDYMGLTFDDGAVLSAHEECMFDLVLDAGAHFPRYSQEKTEAHLFTALVRRVAKAVSWERQDDEQVMRAVLKECGMPMSEVRALTNFLNERIKKSQR